MIFFYVSYFTFLLRGRSTRVISHLIYYDERMASDLVVLIDAPQVEVFYFSLLKKLISSSVGVC